MYENHAESERLKYDGISFTKKYRTCKKIASNLIICVSLQIRGSRLQKGDYIFIKRDQRF